MGHLWVFWVLGVMAGFATAAGGLPTPAGGPDQTTGVEGVVTLRFVPGLPDVEPPPPSPLEGAAVQVLRAKGEDVVAQTRTDARGVFRVALEPGEYRVAVTPPRKGIERPAPTAVTVTKGAFSKVRIELTLLGV